MSEPTLNLSWGDYLSEIGSFLGWGRGEDKGDRAWGSRKQAQLEDIVKSGLRKAYWPSLPPPMLTYDWSFLRLFHTMTIPDGTSELDLPADFGGFEGVVYVTDADDTNARAVKIVDEAQVVFAQTRQPDDTGVPMLISDGRLKGTNSQRSDRTKLRVWPIPDADYTLKFRYHILPEALMESHPYNYGGATHAEMFLESCLSVAELRLDNIANGPHEQAFQKALVASIGKDRNRKAQTFGYNRDYSDGTRLIREHGRSFTTVDDVLY